MTIDTRGMLPESARAADHFGIAYGLGVDSTAVLVELVRRQLRPDFILFADVGSGKEGTYRFLPVIQEFLAAAGFPPVTVVKYEPVRSPYTTIEGNMTMNATLPGAVFNRGSCTVKWKIAPQEKWVKQHRHLYPGRIVKAIGFDAGEGYRRRRANDKVHAAANDRYVYWCPLQDWGWDRNACKAANRNAGLPVPPKSACFFCANMKPTEVLDLNADERGRIVRMESAPSPTTARSRGCGAGGACTTAGRGPSAPHLRPSFFWWMTRISFPQGQSPFIPAMSPAQPHGHAARHPDPIRAQRWAQSGGIWRAAARADHALVSPRPTPFSGCGRTWGQRRRGGRGAPAPSRADQPLSHAHRNRSA